ncbi:hypothetical protein MW887_007532 [Aspergillus wentii]|nr:hypothetical protein MW887_007532 [Aspergillus wentii]
MPRGYKKVFSFCKEKIQSSCKKEGKSPSNSSSTSFHSSSSYQSRPPLLRLPADLIEGITYFLSPASQVSLALTCKLLLQTINADNKLQKSKKLQDSNTFYHTKTLDPWSLFCTHRWALLLLLEDDKWRCCADCSSLHPHKEFPSAELDKPAHERKCGLGMSAGYIDLCPCYRLTSRKLWKLFTQLKTGVNRPMLGWTTDGVRFSHTCQHSQEWWSIDMTVTLGLSIDKSEVYVNTNYSMPAIIMHSPKLRATVPFSCCRRANVLQRLVDMTRIDYDINFGLRRASLANIQRRQCELCPSCRVPVKVDHKDHGRIYFRTSRAFSKGMFRYNNQFCPHSSWFSQCIYENKTELQEHVLMFNHKNTHWRESTPYTPGNLLEETNELEEINSIQTDLLQSDLLRIDSAMSLAMLFNRGHYFGEEWY